MALKLLFKYWKLPATEPSINNLEERAMRSTKGFSLIELLIVVAIIYHRRDCDSQLVAGSSGCQRIVRSGLTALVAERGDHLFQQLSDDRLCGCDWAIGWRLTPCSPSSSTACIIDNFLATATAGGVEQERLLLCGNGSREAAGRPTTLRPSSVRLRS